MSELVEGARLEIVCTAKSGTEGSNPSLSAKKIQPVRLPEKFPLAQTWLLYVARMGDRT